MAFTNIGGEFSPWWAVFVSVSCLLVIGISVLVSFGITAASESKKSRDGGKQRNVEHINSEGKKSARQQVEEDDDKVDSIEKEAWCPKYMRKPWTEADNFPGCPWNFRGCDSVPAVIERIWRPPLTIELEATVVTLKERVKNVHIAWVSLPFLKEVHYVIMYTLNTGAELIGGAPLDLEVGVNLDSSIGPGDEEDISVTSGMRQRRGKPKTVVEEYMEEELSLPCLTSFSRIHDGFGVLLNIKHLPVLLSNPTDCVNGTCFYVYPLRSLLPIAGKPNIFKFARVDRDCVACVDRRDQPARVIYVERNGEMTEDDEAPVSFIADTIRNIAGQRVVPSAYMGSLANNGATNPTFVPC